MKASKPQNKKAIAFLRVSTGRQTEGVSIDVQRQQTHDYAAEKGLSLERVISLAESAKSSMDRQKYQNARRQALKEGFDVFLFYQTDREARNLTDYEENEDLARQGIIELHYVRDRKILNMSSPESDFTGRAYQAVHDKSVSRTISQKVRDAMRNKAESGDFPGNTPPVGYIHAPRYKENGTALKRNKRLVPNPDPQIQAWVKKEFELRAKGYSLDAIRRHCLDAGLVPQKYIKSYSKSSVENRLKNPLYRGRFMWGGIEYQGNHELIIDGETLRKVDMSFRLKKNGKRMLDSAFGGGFLRCGHPECNGQITYDPKTKKNRKGEVRFYKYYRCTNGRGIHEHTPYTTEEKIFEQLAVAVDSIAITEAFAQQVSTALKQMRSRANEASRAIISDCEAKIQKQREEESRLTDFFMAGDLDRDLFQRKRDEIKKRQEAAFADLQRAQETINGDYMITAQKILELSIAAKSLWESRNNEEKVEFLKMINSNHWLEGTTIRFELKKPFAVLAEMAQKSNWLAG
jgi:site-specific DNA recombinase